MIGHYTKKSGWVIDATSSKVIDAGVDYTLGVVLKGTTASVTLNGQVLLGYSFNAATVDGNFGLLAVGGAASFDDVKIKTNDAAFIPSAPSNMVAEAALVSDAGAGDTLTQSALDSVAEVAIAQWTDALGEGDPRLASLSDIRITVADLAGDALGYFDGVNILVDADAAGHGWFVDVTPTDSEEYSLRLDHNVIVADSASAAFGRMDLLTVITHELGHAIGYVDNEPGHAVMDEDLEAGVRYLLDKVGFDADPDRPISDAALIQLAAKAARLESAKGGLSFDFDTEVAAGSNAGINWQASSGDSWGTRYSPFSSGKPSQGASANFSDFLLKLFKGGEAVSPASGYDSMGSDLLGAKDGKGKTGDRPGR